MSNFKNLMIGKVDVNDKQLREGDFIEIEICKSSMNNSERIIKKGIIIYSYKDMAFSIKENNGYVTPLCNFAPKCEFKKI